MKKDKSLKHWMFRQGKKRKQAEKDAQAFDKFLKRMDKIWGGKE